MTHQLETLPIGMRQRFYSELEQLKVRIKSGRQFEEEITNLQDALDVSERRTWASKEGSKPMGRQL